MGVLLFLLLEGLEPEGAWKRAGGTFQPEVAFAAAKVESHHRHHVGAGFISLAPTFSQKSERAHAAAPPFQIEPASLGFDLVLRAVLMKVAASIVLRCYKHSSAPVGVLLFLLL